jgi:hypothetical protein
MLGISTLSLFWRGIFVFYLISTIFLLDFRNCSDIVVFVLFFVVVFSVCFLFLFVFCFCLFFWVCYYRKWKTLEIKDKYRMYGVGECNSLISNNIHLLWKPFDDLITWVAFVKPIYLSFDGIFGFLCYKYIDINFQFNLSFNKSFWPCIADNT